ncbi:hypothetical protein ABTQ07_19595, partial [Acinetobacter baumannii]
TGLVRPLTGRVGAITSSTCAMSVILTHAEENYKCSRHQMKPQERIAFAALPKCIAAAAQAAPSLSVRLPAPCSARAARVPDAAGRHCCRRCR